MVTSCETERQTIDVAAEILDNELLDVISQGGDDDVEFEEIIDNNDHGEVIGNCKWFNKKLGYGFITVYTGARRGMNIFVHHTGIKPLNSNFRTLRKGEYVNFDIVDGQNGLQATNVTGIMGGPLMCDNVESRRTSFDEPRNSSDNLHKFGVPQLHINLQNPNEGRRRPVAIQC